MHRIDSRDNPYVKHLCKLIEDSAYRIEMQKVVISGKNQILELLPFVQSGTIYTTEAFETPLKQVIISESVAKKFNASCIAEFQMPSMKLPEKCTHLLALDRVSDPGNMGTLMRTAIALGWDGVFLLPGCCDPFNDKALRASKGAPFKLPFIKGTWEAFDQIAAQHKLIPLAADLEGTPLENCQKNNCFLILGNEGQGLSTEGLARGQKITIPLAGNMESLNVSAAGAILMYSLRNS